ncbi:MAG: hypothetical protein GF317_19835 [Candidatus Lokiarchaeota archaeon]|nr:hypothetical protein [Candidatus Lokiarchaeota archaeon]MBD3201744.1 hypothetical protein [Candidatus Lokiarchaeota archaeon]
MSIYKEDIEEAKERLAAWWDHEIIDRPCISYFLPKSNIPFKGVWDLWYLAKNWDDIEGCLDDFEDKAESLHFRAENIPWLFLNYGPGILASVFGANMTFKSETVWFNRQTPVDEIVPYLESIKLNGNNKWYNRLLKVTEYAAKRAGNNYSISVTDLGGVLDILSSFLGPTNIILTMKRNPSIIDKCRSIILEKLLKVYNELQSIIEKYQDGCNCWLPVWCPKRWYPIQSDFSAMLSPKFFKRFALPDIIEQAESLDYAIYHLDGPGQIVHLDDLLKEPSITGIQWVPGAGEEPAESEKWFPLYKKIQNAGKNIIADNPLDAEGCVTQLYKKFDPKGLFMILVYLSDIQAKYYLPDFLGGNYGEGEYRQFKREYRKRIKNRK